MITPSWDNIIIFDGDCLLCTGFVKIIIEMDKEEIFRFTSSSSQFFSVSFPDLDIRDADKTVYLVKNGKLYSKSDAVFQIIRQLPFPVWVLGNFRFIPRFIRDWVYDFIADRRKRFFGKKNYCEVMNSHQRARILE